MLTIKGGAGESGATGHDRADTDGWGPELGSSSQLLPPEHLAHINSLIVRTHSRHNDSLFVDDGIVD